MNDLRLWVVGCVRDCGRYLPSVFRNVDHLRPWFFDVQVRLLENNSQDDTAAQIRAYASSYEGVHWRELPELDDLALVRTERLAHLRNALLAWMRSRGIYRCAVL